MKNPPRRPVSSRPFLTTLPASSGSNPERLLDLNQPVQRINAPPTINWLSDFWTSKQEKNGAMFFMFLVA